MVEHRVREKHDVPAVSVLVHGGEDDDHREKGHGEAAGGDELEPLEPEGQLPPGEDAAQLPQTHQQADRAVEDVGQFGVHREHDGPAHGPAHGDGDDLEVHDQEVHCRRGQLPQDSQDVFQHRFTLPSVIFC